MSRHAMLVLLGLALVSGIQPVAAGATQPSADSLASARRARILRLQARSLEIDSVMARARLAKGGRLLTDTISAGAFRIATSADLVARVREEGEAVSASLRSVLDTVARASVRQRLLQVAHADPMQRRLVGFDHLLVGWNGGWSPVWPREAQDATPWRSRDQLTRPMRALVTEAVTATMDDAFRGWILNAAIPIERAAPALEQRARLELATAESESARRCVGGEIAACARTLELHGRPRDVLASWYAPRDYRPLVARMRMAPSDGAAAPRLQSRCLGGDDSACIDLLAALDPRRLPAPTLEAPRVLLLDEALRIGGDGALTRLRATTGDIGARLSVASGVSENSLLASWRRRMTVSSGRDARPTPTLALATIGWTLLLAGAGMRRTRRCR